MIMKSTSIVLIVMFLTVPLSSFAADGEVSSQTDSLFISGVEAGTEAAESDFRGGDWFEAGFFTGMFMPFFSISLVVKSQHSKCEVPEHYLDEKQHIRYQMGFVDGYQESTRHRRFSSMSKGNLIGTAIFVSAMIVVFSQVYGTLDHDPIPVAP